MFLSLNILNVEMKKIGKLNNWDLKKDKEIMNLKKLMIYKIKNLVISAKFLFNVLSTFLKFFN